MSDGMETVPIDAELLASFLDGTATPTRRELVLRAMATSAEHRAVVLEAAAIQRQLGDALPSSSPKPDTR